MDSGGKPYTDAVLNSRQRLRVFDKNTEQHELVWHRDHSNRKIVVVSGHGWQFQLDNQLPVDLHAGVWLHIPTGEYHRLLRHEDCSDLELIIDEDASQQQ